LRTIDLEVEREPFAQCIGELVGFAEQVAGIDQDHRNTGL